MHDNPHGVAGINAGAMERRPRVLNTGYGRTAGGAQIALWLGHSGVVLAATTDGPWAAALAPGACGGGIRYFGYP